MNESKILAFVTLVCWWLANHYCLSDSCLLMIGKPNLNANKFSWQFVWIIESKQIVKICKGGQGGPDVSLEVWIVLCCDRILLTLLTPPTPNWGFLGGFWHHISFQSGIGSFFRMGTRKSTDLRWPPVKEHSNSVEVRQHNCLNVRDQQCSVFTLPATNWGFSRSAGLAGGIAQS